MKINKYTVGSLETNCYLIYNENEGIIIDPGAVSFRLEDDIQKLSLNISCIFNTHGHADHVIANNTYYNKYKSPVIISEDDSPMLESPNNDLLSLFGLHLDPFSPQNTYQNFHSDSSLLKDFSVIFTPGHSPGSVCLLFNNKNLFSGDTIFKYNIGRSDLPGGNHKKLINSISNNLLTLDNQIIIHPGHGPQTTIKNEKLYNPFF